MKFCATSRWTRMLFSSSSCNPKDVDDQFWASPVILSLYLPHEEIVIPRMACTLPLFPGKSWFDVSWSPFIPIYACYRTHCVYLQLLLFVITRLKLWAALRDDRYTRITEFDKFEFKYFSRIFVVLGFRCVYSALWIVAHSRFLTDHVRRIMVNMIHGKLVFRIVKKSLATSLCTHGIEEICIFDFFLHATWRANIHQLKLPFQYSFS
jgi:hypothetical protein